MLIENKRIAIFIADCYDEMEFWYPFYRMKEGNAEVLVIGPSKGTFVGRNGMKAVSDFAIENVKADQFDALIIPGGFAPDYMRREPGMVDFVRRISEQGKLVAAISHGPWLLASASLLKNRTITSYYSIKDDLVNAGAYWIDQNVVADNNFITARKPSDLPIFCKAIVDKLAKS